jgi:hypothetical protein
MSLFLTPDELIELSGYKQPRKIMAWLDEQGYRYRVNGKGWPSVLRDVVLLDLQGQTTARRPQLRLA